MKVTITIESIGNNEYRLTTEDDVAITTEISTSPQKTILASLTAMGVKGKRGRKKGSTLAKTSTVATAIFDSVTA